MKKNTVLLVFLISIVWMFGMCGKKDEETVTSLGTKINGLPYTIENGIDSLYLYKLADILVNGKISHS